MKKHRKAKLFLEEIQKTPVVAAVCNKLNISRQSIYKWLKEDKEFRKLYNEAISRGVNNINDLAESKMIGSIDHGESWAIKYWLESNNHKYLRPRLPANNIRNLKEDDVDEMEIQVRTTKYNESNDPRDEDPELQP